MIWNRDIKQFLFFLFFFLSFLSWNKINLHFGTIWNYFSPSYNSIRYCTALTPKSFSLTLRNFFFYSYDFRMKFGIVLKYFTMKSSFGSQKTFYIFLPTSHIFPSKHIESITSGVSEKMWKDPIYLFPFFFLPFPLFRIVMLRFCGQPDVPFWNLVTGSTVAGWIIHDKINRCKTLLQVVRLQFDAWRTRVLLKNFCPMGKIRESLTIWMKYSVCSAVKRTSN